MEIFVVRYEFDWHIVGAHNVVSFYFNAILLQLIPKTSYGFEVKKGMLNRLENVWEREQANGRFNRYKRWIHKLLLPAFNVHYECKLYDVYMI